MNVILSLILSFVMVFSGAADLPAIPETATTYTVSNISITYGDETVDLSPALRLTAATGSERAELGFEVQMDDQLLLPLNGRIAEDGVSFSLSDSGKAYSISAEVLDELMGLEQDSDMQMFVQLFERMAAIVPALEDPAVEEALSEISMNVLIEGVEPDETEVDINGAAVPAMAYTIEITEDTLVALLDAWLACDIPAVKDFCQLILDVGNMESGTQYANFAEVFAAEGLEGFSLPMDITIAEQDGVLYEQVYISAELEGQVLDLDVVMQQEGENYAMEMNYYLGGDADYISYSVMGAQAADGSFELVYDISSGSSYSYSETNTETGESIEEVFEQDTYMLVTASGEAADDGMMDIYFTMDATNVNTSTAGDEVDYAESAFSIEGQVSQLLEEDGSITSDCYFSLLVPEEEVSVELSFQVNAAEAAYADPFEGKEILALTAEDLSGDSETLSAAMNQLMADALALTADAMTISADEGILALSELGVEEVSMEAAADYDEYTEEYSEEEYSMDYPENLDEAIAVYGYDVPQLSIPEDYELSYAYATNGYLSVDYVRGEDYINVSMYPTYQDMNTLLLKADGSFVEPDGVVVNLMEEEGAIYSAEVTTGTTGISIYSYSGEMSMEDLQGMLSSLVQ